MDLELLIFNRKGWQLVLALLASIRLCYVCVNSNELIKVSQLQKLATQSMLNGTLVKEMVLNSFSESKKKFGCLLK